MYKNEIKLALNELLNIANLNQNNIFVLGCSTSEIIGSKIGTNSAENVAVEILDAIMPIFIEKNIFLATQCCEHLNRALVIDISCKQLYNLEEVAVIPIKKAGGSISAEYYKKLKNPCVVEFIKANAGMDIGDTFIGMHLKHVAVPVRLSVKKIGEANLTSAITRPKFIGGERAVYRSN